MTKLTRIRDLELANRRATDAAEIIGTNARARETDARMEEAREAEASLAEARTAGARTVEAREVVARAANARAEARAAEARTMGARAAEARARAAEARAEAREMGARATEAEAAEARVTEARIAGARVAEAMAAEASALARSMIATIQDEAPALNRILEEGDDTRQLEPARAVLAPTVQTTESAVQTTPPISSELAAAIRALTDRVGQLDESLAERIEQLDERFQADQRQAATRELTMLRFIASLSASSGSGGGGQRTGQGGDQAADQVPDRASEDEGEDEGEYEGEEEGGYEGGEEGGYEGEEGGEGEGEEEAASPTPAELLAAGDSVGNDGRRNHQREGRYYCPICGAYTRTLGDVSLDPPCLSTSASPFIKYPDTMAPTQASTVPRCLDT
ncbi:hypothetical protein HOY82DRAFT_605820 [Tuber indicum]|nr:hypothetical protein HOY82DRAFT_605820 [Tuber indicum]